MSDQIEIKPTYVAPIPKGTAKHPGRTPILTPAQVFEIRTKLTNGSSYVDICADYRISFGTAFSAAHGKGAYSRKEFLGAE